MFAQPQRLRRLAVHVLLMWLFVLGTGVVHACVVRAAAGGAPAVAHCHEAVDAAADAADAHEAAVNDQDPGRIHTPCERLCDAPSVVPQAENQLSNPLSGFWLACAPLPAFAFQPGAAPDRSQPSAPDRWHKSVPVSIAFLRLTL
jgi:hypothetical protein